MNNNLYPLSQIKKAFWAEFHEAGEVWFDYVSTPEENNQSTESHWESFLEALELIKNERYNGFNWSLDYRRNGQDWPAPYRVRILPIENKSSDFRIVAYGNSEIEAHEKAKALIEKQNRRFLAIPEG